jgi:hypothetical protein
MVSQEIAFLSGFPATPVAVDNFLRKFIKALASLLKIDSKMITIKKFEQTSRRDLRRILLSSSATIDYIISVPGGDDAASLTGNLEVAVSSHTLTESLARNGVPGVVASVPTITNYSPTSAPTVTPSGSPIPLANASSESKISSVVIIGAALGGVIGLLLLALLAFLYKRDARRHKVYVVDVEFDDCASDKGSEKSSYREVMLPYRLPFIGPETTV